MQCVDEDELLRFVGGALDEARARIIRAHVDTCDDCREGLAIAAQEAVAAAAPEGGRWKIEVGAEVEGRFRIEREIGRGGMGVVYAATHLSMRRNVALKVLNEDVAEDEDCVARFLRETRVAARLASANAMRVFDVGRLASGAPFMVMELLDGQDLEQVYRDGPVDVTTAVRWVADACNAIGEAHDAGIVHRDVKLANLFLAKGSPPIVKVLDFGLAKGGRVVGGETGESSLTNANAMMGTPHYMSPEQLVSARDVDARADVWALGVALYRLLTRRYPFEGTNLAQLFVRVMSGTPPTPPKELRADVPMPVERVVMRCLEQKPDARYADANALRIALVSALEPVTLEATRVEGKKVEAPTPAPAPTPANEVSISVAIDVPVDTQPMSTEVMAKAKAVATSAPRARENAGTEWWSKAVLYGVVGVAIGLGVIVVARARGGDGRAEAEAGAGAGAEAGAEARAEAEAEAGAEARADADVAAVAVNGDGGVGKHRRVLRTRPGVAAPSASAERLYEKM